MRAISSNSSKKIVFIVLAILIICGFFLRLINLGQLPAVMHRDELAIGYNAYSILETGRDEWGKVWPVVFKSFGDYKLPGLIYSTILGVKLFGMNQFGSRVITAIFASLAIPAMFLFTKELFKSRFISLFSTLFLVFSFWHISGSRNIYEPIVALSLAIPSYLALFKAAKKTKYLLLSILFFSIAIWFYHTPFFIYPLMYILWSGYNWRKFSDRERKWWVIGFIFVILVSCINFYAVATLNKSRSETTIFMSQELKDRHQATMRKYWLAGVPLHPIFTSAQRSFQLSYYFIQGYFKGISPDFLFFNGGNNSWHNLKSIGFGNLNPVFLPLSILGFIYVFKNRKKPANYFLLCLLILSPIPNALTIDSPNTNRLMDFHFLILVLSAIGLYFYCLLKLVKNNSLSRVYGLLFLTFIFTYVVLTSQFLASYFLIYNSSLESAWHEGFPELIKDVDEYKNNYDKVIISTSNSEAYMFFLFYSHYSPKKIQDQPEGFNHV